MRLYFARHGQTNANASMTNGQSIAKLDEPLNQTGIQQANELAEQLRNIKFDVIVSSPLKRALQTAEIINKYHDLKIVLDDSWRERQASTYIDANSWHDLFDFDKNTQIEDGEAIGDFFARAYEAIEKLKGEYTDKTILVVSHGGMQHALYAYANKLSLAGNMRISPMKNCEYRLYEL